MSKKTKDILFYCFTGLLAVAAIVAAIIDAVKGEGNLAVSIILAVAAVGLLIVSGIEVVDTVLTKDTSKHVNEEIKPVTLSDANINKKDSAKKSDKNAKKTK